MVMHIHVRTDKVVEIEPPVRRTVQELRSSLERSGYDVKKSKAFIYDLRNGRRVVGHIEKYKPTDNDYIRFSTEEVFAPYTKAETAKRLGRHRVVATISRIFE